MKMTNREILDNVLSVEKEYLNSFSMILDETLKENIKSFSLYYADLAGRNHYRILKHISNLYENEILFDIGTDHGVSALALAENTKNQIHTYDIVDHLLENKKYVKRNNIQFFMEDVLEKAETLNNSRFIMLDTFHAGTYEIYFYEKLKEINYKGILFCDDIHLNDDMENFWSVIKHEKYDITDKGHETGSGIVLFE